MMYVDQAGMIARFGEGALIRLTDLGETPSGAIDATVLARALTDAAELIHGYARSGGYAVPFVEPVPSAVAQWQADVAFYMLHRSTPEVPEKLAKDYERTLAQIKDVARGVFRLETADAPAPAAEGETVFVDAPGRVCTASGLRGF